MTESFADAITSQVARLIWLKSIVNLYEVSFVDTVFCPILNFDRSFSLKMNNFIVLIIFVVVDFH